MKLSASFLILSSTLVASEARSSLRRELATSIPTSSVTTYVPTYNDAAFNETDDNGLEEPALTEEIQSEITVETVTSSTAALGEGLMDGPGKPDDMEDMPEHNETMADTMADFFKPEKPEHNDTMVHPGMFHDDNETFADQDHMMHGLKPTPNNSFTDESMPMHESGPHGPKSFQELVDDKCASFECPASSNSTCPTPPEPADVNGTEMMAPPKPFGMNMTEGMGPLELDDMNMTDSMSLPEPLEGNMTGPMGMGGHGPKHSPERALKPHHKPEELLACACCEGATVDEITETGVDVSGLAFLVGYDPSAATVYDNGSSLNSLFFSSAVVGAAALALFL